MAALAADAQALVEATVRAKVCGGSSPGGPAVTRISAAPIAAAKTRASLRARLGPVGIEQAGDVERHRHDPEIGGDLLDLSRVLEVGPRKVGQREHHTVDVEP